MIITVNLNFNYVSADQELVQCNFEDDMISIPLLVFQPKYDFGHSKDQIKLVINPIYRPIFDVIIT